MYAKVEKSNENESRAIGNSVAKKKNNVKQNFGLVDNREELIAQRKMQNIVQYSSPINRVTNVIQRVSYYPDEGLEPHIHEHNGGVTYTDIGHSHRDLQAGDQIRYNVIQDVMRTLQGYNMERANLIIAWIENHFDVQAPDEEEEEVYVDPDITPEWLDSEQEDHNPEGNAPRDFRFGGGRGNGVGYDR